MQTIAGEDDKFHSLQFDTDDKGAIRYIRYMENRLLKSIKENRWLLAILLASMVIRLIYLTEYFGMPEWNQLTVDNFIHHNWAQVLARGNILGDTTYFRAPFYIWCLGLLYFLFGASLWVGRLFGLTIGLGSILLTYMIGRKIFDRRTGLVAASIHTVYPAMLYFESELLLDPLFTLLFQIAIYRLIVWVKSATDRNLFWVGITIGLAAITRPTALILIPLLLILIVMERHGKMILVRSVIIFSVGLIILIGPIFVRNIVVAGDPVLISSQGGINFFIGNNESSDGSSATMPLPYGYNWKLADVTYDAEQATGRNLKPGEVSDYWYTQGLKWIIKNPVRFVGRFFAKLYYHIGNREISNNRSLQLFYERMPLLGYNPLSFGLIFALALTGIFSSWHLGKPVVVTVTSMLLLCAVGSLFFFSSRFRLPLIPFFIIFASAGGFSLFKISKDIFAGTQPYKKLIPLVIIAVIGAAVSFYPIVGYNQSAPVFPILSKTRELYGQGRYDQAIQTGRIALRLNENFPDVHLNLGAAFFRKGMGDSARFHFNREMETFPGRIEAYVNEGSLDLVSGDAHGGAIMAAKALSLRPYDLSANLLFVRSLASDTTVPSDSLERTVERSALVLRNDLTFMNEAGAILLEHKLFEHAIKILKRGLKSTPPPIETDDQARSRGFSHLPARQKRQKGITYYHLGLIAGLSRQYDNAIEYNLKAIELNPDMVESYINLAAGYVSSGRKEEADSLLIVASVRFPGNQLITRMKAALE